MLGEVPATAYGLHTSVYDNELADTTALATLVPKTGVTVLRYPGGSYADRYHWAQYTTTPAFHSDAVCGLVANGYLAAAGDFGSFVRTLEATGTEAMITVNYGTSVANAAGSRSRVLGEGATANESCSEPNTAGQPQEAAAWVAYANGASVDLHVIGEDSVGFTGKQRATGRDCGRLRRWPWMMGTTFYGSAMGLLACGSGRLEMRFTTTVLG